MRQMRTWGDCDDTPGYPSAIGSITRPSLHRPVNAPGSPPGPRCRIAGVALAKITKSGSSYASYRRRRDTDQPAPGAPSSIRKPRYPACPHGRRSYECRLGRHEWTCRSADARSNALVASTSLMTRKARSARSSRQWSDIWSSSPRPHPQALQYVADPRRWSPRRPLGAAKADPAPDAPGWRYRIRCGTARGEQHRPHPLHKVLTPPSGSNGGIRLKPSARGRCQRKKNPRRDQSGSKPSRRRRHRGSPQKSRRRDRCDRTDRRSWRGRRNCDPQADVEGRAAAAELRLRDAKHNERNAHYLEGRRVVIAELLAALQRIGRRLPPALMVRPEDASICVPLPRSSGGSRDARRDRRRGRPERVRACTARHRRKSPA